MKLVDSHCHLDFKAFDPDREAVLERASQAGVGQILNPGVDLETSRAAVRLAEQYPQVYAAVGVHPNEAGSWEAETPARLRELAGHPKAAAVGEIGLDFYRQRSPHDLQRSIFRQQLELAVELDLPVVVHTRSPEGDGYPAMEEALRMIEGLAQKGRLRGVFHAFSADLALAQRALELGFMLGFGGPLTYKNAARMQETARQLPPESLLVETDAPFLPPQPQRGRRNEPAFVRLVAEKMADLRVKSFDEVAQTSTHNATRLFQW